MRVIAALFTPRSLAAVLMAGLLFGATPAWAQPAFSKTFAPGTMGPGSISTLTFLIINGDPVNPVTDLAFTDNLPAGMTIATPPRVISDCINALISAPAGGATITVTDGRLGAGVSCSISVDVTAATPGTLMNVSGDLTSSAGNSGPAVADLTVDTNRPGFSKSFAPASVVLGARSRLTFTVDNTLSPVAAFNLFFTDELPLGMVVANPANTASTCAAGTFTATPGTRNISFLAGFVAANSSCMLAVDVTAQAAGQLGNTTGVMTASIPQSVMVGRAGAVLDVTVGTNLVLTKAFVNDPVAPGGITTMQFTLFNRNRVFTASNITLTDDLDATLSGLTAVGLPQLDVCGAGSLLSGTSLITLNGASLAPEGSCTFSVPVQVPAAAPAGAYPNTTSTVSADIAGSPVMEPAAADTLFVSDAPTLTKTFLSNPAGAGEVVTLEFTLTSNHSVQSTSDISFMDNLEGFLSGVAVVALPANGFCGAGSTAVVVPVGAFDYLVVSGANLPPGGSCTFSVDVQLAPNTPSGDYLNITTNLTATVAGATREGNAAMATLSVAGAPQLRKAFTDDPVLPGAVANLRFTLTLPEEATQSVTGINFSDDLNAVLSGLSAVGLPLNDICGSGSQLSGTTSLSFTGGALAPGASCSFDVAVQVPAAALPGVYPNTTSAVMGTAAGVAVTGQAATDDFLVGGLSFTKTFTDDPVPAGGTVTLEFTITNQLGTEAVTDIAFTDNLNNTLGGLTAVGLPANDICGLGSQISGTNLLSFSGGNLTGGTSCTFSVTVQVPVAAADNNYVNTTSTLSAIVVGNPVVIPAAADTLTVDSALLTLTKTFTDDPVAPGDTVTLEFTVANTHPTQSITGITFTDDLDATLSGLAALGLPANDVCGAGSQISGVGLLTLTGGTLAPGASCIFSVTLQVTTGAAGGVYPNTTSQAVGNLGGLPVQGAAASDDVVVSFFEFSKSFAGPVVTGQTTTLSYTLTNQGPTLVDNLRFSDDLDAALSGLVALGLPLNDGCGAGSLVSGSALVQFEGGVLAAGTSCSFDITVMVPAGLPTGNFPSTSSELTTSGLPVAVPATATLQVLGQALIDIAPPVTDFGDVRTGTSSAALAVTITNTGTADLSVSALDAALAPFSLSGGSCAAVPFTLAMGTSCTLDYVFSPLVTGAAMQTLAVNSNAPGSPVNFELRGNGIAPLVQITPAVVDFGVVELNTVTPAQSVTLSNTGDADLNVTAISAAAAPFSASGGSCAVPPFVLAPGAGCTLDYQFAPTVVGNASDTVSVQSDAAGSPHAFTLQGVGAEALLALSTADVNFGVVPLNTGASRALVLTNSGMVDVVVSAVSGPSAPFSVLPGTCGAVPFTLAPAAACELELRFDPLTAGDFSDNLVLTSNAADSPVTVVVRGFGTVIVAVPALNPNTLLALALGLFLVGAAWIRWRGV